jgi:hypothetical protein
MATVNWKSGVSGSWETGANWSSGAEPGPTDVVSIGVAGTYTVTIGAAAAAYALAMSDPTATLVMNANLSLGGGLSDTHSLIDIAAGTLAVAAGSVTFGDNSSATTGPSIDGPGTLSTAASVATTIDPGPNGYDTTELVLGGGVTWSNSGTVSDTGKIQIGDGSGETANIVNNAGGLFQFLSPYATIYDNAGASGTFINSGEIDVGTSTYFAPNLTNTGVIDLKSGTIDLATNSTIGGTLTGGGVLEVGGGATTLTAVTSGNLLVAGGVLTLEVTGSITGNVSETSGGIDLIGASPATETLTNGFSDTHGEVSLIPGKTLSLTGGTVTFGDNTSASVGPSVDGSGTLSTAAGVTTTIDPGPNGYDTTELVLGGGVTWSNSGTVSDTGKIQIGDGSGETANIVNNAGGLFQFLSPYATIYDNAGASGTFINSGEIDVGTSTYFAPNLTNTGVIDLKSGTIDLATNSTIGGTLTGGGVLEVGGGATTLTAVTSGNLLVAGGVLTLEVTGSITGNVSETSGGIDLIGASPATETLTNGFSDTHGEVSLIPGKTLSLTGGTVTFGDNTSASVGPSVDGSGTLSTAAGVTTTIDPGPNGYDTTELVLGGGVTWSNSGTVSDTGKIQIGDGSGETAKIVNKKGAVFQFLSPYAAIVDNAGATGSFSNAGTLVNANTSGGTYLGASLTSKGLISLQSGTLVLGAGATIGGKVTGTGTLAFSAGTSTLTAATSGNLLVDGGVLTLAPTTTVSGNITETSGALLLGKNVALSGVLLDSGGIVTLAGNTLSGPAVTISGSGTLTGYGSIAAPVIDNGTLIAQQGVLTLATGASGSGVFDLAGAGSLEFLGSATANIGFLSGGAETLLLAQPGAVTATISGFAATDAIDLVKTAATGLGYANNTLTVTGAGGTIAVLGFAGQYSAANFSLQSDQNGGTDIVYVPGHLAAQAPVAEHFAGSSYALSGWHGMADATEFLSHHAMMS